MQRRSSLTEEQREQAVRWFEEGRGDWSVATHLGVSRWPVTELYHRWRLRGRDALVRRAAGQTYPFEVKLALVTRYLAGEAALALAAEGELSSPTVLQRWARQYRQDGEDALRPKPKGRPPAPPPGATDLSELDQLRRENEYLRAQVAYLGKVQALLADERRSRSTPFSPSRPTTD